MADDLALRLLMVAIAPAGRKKMPNGRPDRAAQRETQPMNTPQGSIEPNLVRRTQSVRTIYISAAVSAACFALYIAEGHGFRIFEESVRKIQTAEAVVPSPMEILTVLGITSLGVCAGIVALISCIVWIVQHLRPAHDAGHGDYASTATGSPAHQSTS